MKGIISQLNIVVLFSILIPWQSCEDRRIAPDLTGIHLEIEKIDHRGFSLQIPWALNDGVEESFLYKLDIQEVSDDFLWNPQVLVDMDIPNQWNNPPRLVQIDSLKMNTSYYVMLFVLNRENNLWSTTDPLLVTTYPQPIDSMAPQPIYHADNPYEPNPAYQPPHPVESTPWERAVFYNDKGMEYYLQKNYRRAADYFRFAIVQDSSNILPHYNLACVLSLLYGERLLDDMAVNEMYDELEICFALDAERVGRDSQWFLSRLKEDPDLNPIRHTQRFQRLLEMPIRTWENSGRELLIGQWYFIPSDYQQNGEEPTTLHPLRLTISSDYSVGINIYDSELSIRDAWDFDDAWLPLAWGEISKEDDDSSDFNGFHFDDVSISADPRESHQNTYQLEQEIAIYFIESSFNLMVSNNELYSKYYQVDQIPRAYYEYGDMFFVKRSVDISDLSFLAFWLRDQEWQWIASSPSWSAHIHWISYLSNQCENNWQDSIAQYRLIMGHPYLSPYLKVSGNLPIELLEFYHPEEYQDRHFTVSYGT